MSLSVRRHSGGPCDSLPLPVGLAGAAAAHAAHEHPRRRRKVELAQLRQSLEDLDRTLVAVEQARDDPELLRRDLEVAATRKAELNRRWQRVVARERAALSRWSRTR
jgi:hypothetical protein